MKKTKILSSIILTTIFATSAVLAWTDLWVVSDSDTLTSTLWNTVVWKINENGDKLGSIYNVWGNIWIWEPTPAEKLEIDWSIKINSGVETVTISVDTWNEIQKNLNKTWYRFWTYNTTDAWHSWQWTGTNFRNCEVVQYFQAWETIQNTSVYTSLSYVLWSSRTSWSSNPNHTKFLRDFNTSYTDTTSSVYASWATLIYWPSKLERCAID